MSEVIIRDPVAVENSLVTVGPILLGGITAAVAYTNGDQMGSLIPIGVPREGTILEVRFHDLDDEGIDKELWLFSRPVTLAADNAAFSLSDTDNFAVVAVFLFDVWRDAVNNQVGLTANTPANYRAPQEQLYCAVKTKGADNITLGSEPHLSFVIERRRG